MNLENESRKLQKQVSENQMSRHRFMQGAMALGVGAILGCLALAAPSHAADLYNCSFTHGAVQSSAKVAFTPSEYEVRRTEMDLSFVVDGDVAYMIGNVGNSPVNLFWIGPPAERDGVQFVEITTNGVLQVTAIDSSLNAVHSRHTVFLSAIIPQQYYGSCSVQ